MQTHSPTQADADLTQLRRDMLRFARMQLRDDALAEDAVQEAMIAAHEKQHSFDGRSSYRTWVFVILRNKIIDLLRKQRHDISLDSHDASVDAMFDEQDHWREESTPADWGAPDAALESSQFWTVFEACLYRLQEAAARAFMLREMMGYETAEICSTLNIKPNHCGVLLHRARLSLRACLEYQWFNDGSIAEIQ